MVTLTPAPTATQLGLTLNSAGSPSAALSSQPFMQALSDAIAGALEKFGIDPGSVTLNLGTPARQNVAASPASVASSAASSVPALPIAPAVQPSDTRIGFNALVPLDPIPSAAPPPQAPVAPHVYASDPADDLYWSRQPPAVQQLRGIDDYDKRQALGSKLASQGYQIDIPVMVWGWGAGKTMDLRKSFGYTWVPSALQAQVSAAPGLTVPALAPYDPAHPPLGSIQV